VLRVAGPMPTLFPYTTLFRSDFARGFSLTEGIIDKVSDIRGIDIVSMAQGVVVQLEIATACEVRLKGRRRALAGRTGCGLCGVRSEEHTSELQSRENLVCRLL